MGGIGDAAHSQGDVMRRLRALEGLVRELIAGRRLENATIGAGGIRIKGAGGLTLQDGGDLAVEDGGDVVVSGGGGVEVQDGGRLRTRHPDGRTATFFGPVYADQAATAQQGIGLAVWSDFENAGAGSGSLFFAIQDELLGILRVQAGATDSQIDEFRAFAKEFEVTADDVELHAAVAYDVFGPLPNSRVSMGNTGDAFFTADVNAFYTAGNQIKLTADGASAFIDANGGSVVIGSSTNEVFVDHTTTTNAANCEITTTGLLRRSTSSRRYKDDIADLDLDPRQVLKMRPRTWRDKRPPAPARPTPDGEPDPPKPQADPVRGVGFIAEELDELGLGAFVSYDEQGRPDAVAYDRIPAALIGVIKDQQRQIDALSARLDAVEAP